MHPLLSVINQKNDLRIQDVFDVSLYTATGAGLSVTNGIDLATHGGFVWERCRNNATAAHSFIDNKRGLSQYILPHSAGAEGTDAAYMGSFNTNGFTLTTSELAGRTIAANTFRIAPKFLDIVTYTGTGSARTVAHNLGIEPGMIWVKQLNAARNWGVWHRSLTNQQALILNAETGYSTSNVYWNNTAPTNSNFSVGTSTTTNSSGGSYVAYVFAHNPPLIQCGSYTGNSSTTGPTVSLGWNPQWLMLKAADQGSNSYRWSVYDTARGLGAGNDAQYSLNDQMIEGSSFNLVDLTGTGFQLKSTAYPINESGTTYIYMAIREE